MRPIHVSQPPGSDRRLELIVPNESLAISIASKISCTSVPTDMILDESILRLPVFLVDLATPLCAVSASGLPLICVSDLP
jgi:hypothetical protein